METGATNDKIIFIGTENQNNSCGIYKAVFNEDTGEITSLTNVADIINPTYLILSRDNKFLYAVSETLETGGENGGRASSFEIDANYNLHALNSVRTYGKSPCHLCLNPSETEMAVANYNEGTITIFNITKGQISEPTEIIKHSGNGPNIKRQEKPHTHFVHYIDDGTFACIDLGIDKIIFYRKKENYEFLSEIKLPSGTGPRHCIFNSDNKYLYVLSELFCDITTIELSDDLMHYEILQNLSLLPKDFSGFCNSAAIKISNNGRCIYCSNRFHDSITIFNVKADHTLSYSQNYNCGGKTPRDIEISRSGKFLLIANQDSDSINVFSIDNKGELSKFPISSINLKKPECIKFI